MTTNEFNSGNDPHEQDEPLSATGMFLRAFDSSSPNSPEATQTSSAKPESPSVSPAPAFSTSSTSGPGEFTQMFQALNQPQAASHAAPVAQTPQSAPALSIPETKAAPVPASTPPPAPGEFTRIFVKASTPSPESQVRPDLPARPAMDTPPAPSPSKMKGFSTPGISDSASAEGSFTQFFKTSAPPPPKSTPAPTVQPFAPPATQAPQSSTSQSPSQDWPRESNFGAAPKQFDVGPDPNQGQTPASSPPPAAGSATGLLSALSSPGAATTAPRQPEPPPYRPESAPFYPAAPPPAEPSSVEAGSVTRLIQRLSQVPKEAPPEQVAPSTPSTAAVSSGPASGASGPGEFTRMISGSAFRAGPEVPTQATPPQPVPAAAAPAPPAIPIPAVKAPAPPPMAAPKFEAPKIEAPKVTPPAVAAPKSKLEAMVPILLVINTFLLVVLLVVVIFAMKSK